MEYSLHRQLKALYADADSRTEVRWGRYRIDVVRRDAHGEELVEIQHGPIAAIRDKLRKLVEEHRVRVVKPLVTRKHLVKRRKAGGRVCERRKSNYRGALVDIFDELMRLTRLFPHPRLVIDVLPVEIEEWRRPGQGRRRRRRADAFIVDDQQLLSWEDCISISTAADLWKLLPAQPPETFDSRLLAERLAVDRSVAQRICYCLRNMGAVTVAGRRRTGWVYQRPGADGPDVRAA